MRELIDSIEEYIRKPYTDYAVMINGEWGSGKTHFWNNKLRQKIETIPNKDGKLYKTIYISLYGINSIEEISKKIFIETNPMMTKTLKKFVDSADGNIIPEYVKTGVDIANLYGMVQTSSHQMDFSKSFSTDDKVLCFDDLERANIDIIDILGYINNFVEHDGIKTILICNEKELAIKFKNNNIELKTLIATQMLNDEGKLKNKESEDEPIANKIDEKIKSIFDRTNSYERIKEKLIGECFEYMPEYSYILNGMIMRFAYNPELEKFLKKEISTIISVFNKTNTKNLRVLKHSLNDFEKIYTNVTRDYKNIKPEILRTILKFTIAISFEIKVGNAVKQNFSEIESNEEYKSIIYTSQMLNDASTYYLKEFDTRYFLNSKVEYRFYKFVEVYVRTRTFDERIFNDNMRLAIKEGENSVEKTEEYEKLLDGSYWKLSDFDFAVLSDKVILEAKEGNIPSKEYVKLFSVYKYLCDIGVVRHDIQDIKDKFLYGFKLSVSSESIIADSLEITKKVFEKTDVKDSTLKSFVKECKRLLLSIYDDTIREKVNALFVNLISSTDEFYKLILSDYKNVPVFEKYEMETLYSKLEKLSNYDLYNFITIISTRYENNKELLKDDLQNLKILADIIKERANIGEITIKKALLNNLRDTILDLA